MENHPHENNGYSFDPEEKFGWNEKQQFDGRFINIQKGLLTLRDECCSFSNIDDPEDRMLLETMSKVLETLEQSFTHHFELKTGHVVSPKSDEPWD
jgi:hypothetical protein